MAALSDNGILAAIQNRQIVIEPFHASNLNSASYDVTLGPHLYREQVPAQTAETPPVCNPYNGKSVAASWKGPLAAQAFSICKMARSFTVEDDIKPDELVIIVHPGETILSHTNEFIGTTEGSSCVAILQPRSSMERAHVHVQGGWGNVGFINRWCLRITNTSRTHCVPLVVGRRIAQIAFLPLDSPSIRPAYGAIPHRDKYQSGTTLPPVQQFWTPHDQMLPRNVVDARGARIDAPGETPLAPLYPRVVEERRAVPAAVPQQPPPPRAAPPAQQQQQAPPPPPARRGARQQTRSLVPELPADLIPIETRMSGRAPQVDVPSYDYDAI